MASTLVTMLSHIVFSTKHRKPLIHPEIESPLYRYMRGIVGNLDSRCLAINGVENHVHLLVSLAKTLALSDFIRDLKSSSTRWVQRNGAVAGRFQWQDGYGAFSVSASHVPSVISYIERQKEHHRRITFEDEYLALARRYDHDVDMRYVFD